MCNIYSVFGILLRYKAAYIISADDKETLFKAMKEMDSSPERESVLRYMEYINGSFYRNVLFIPLYHDYIIHVCRNDISGFVPQEDAKDRIDITHVFRQY